MQPLLPMSVRDQGFRTPSTGPACEILRRTAPPAP